MNKNPQQFFHIHLVSDATGETLDMVARAAAACYHNHEAIQHTYALVRTSAQLDKVMLEIEKQPGIVLFTLIDADLRNCLENRCNVLGVPIVSILDPVIATLANFLNAKSEPVIGRQHDLNAQYFNRIEALNYTMIHDDGQHINDIDSADVILIGISRTSKTPTSIYLANRGVKVANIPLVPEIPVPAPLLNAKNPLIVGLIASTDRITQIRRHRLQMLNQDPDTDYVDRKAIAEEIRHMKQLCQQHRWPVIDVTRKSIEETAATVLNLRNQEPKIFGETVQ
jgi:regulator of PEP synthase PpsR (kinase-PPPase family)